jgi:D-sedoheptulose 7-phosphate isomerase
VSTTPEETLRSYGDRLGRVVATVDWGVIAQLAVAMRDCWAAGRRVFLCGNGGSAANAMHAANDLHYGAGMSVGRGMRVTALPANVSVLTCLANDEGYEDIFSHQLAVDGDEGDLLIAFSGSGNSPNILAALRRASEMGIRSFAVLGYSGGQAKTLADTAIHFAVDDMQISEDMQMVVIHAVMQWLNRNPPIGDQR